MDVLPWWAGVAWADVTRREYIVLPIGLHRIAGVTRSCWHRFKVRHDDTAIDKARTEGYLVGTRVASEKAWRDGCDHGYERGIRHMVIELKSVLKSE
jgi:hypothetical protein